MHSIFYMIEKELIQHKIIFRLPLFVLVFSLLIIILIAYGFDADVSFSVNSFGDAEMFNMQQGLSTVINFGAAVISYLLSVLYLSKAICRDRQEGSLAFWRSMPVSDLTAHLVKLSVALIVIPLICSILVLSAQLFLWLLSILSPKEISYLIGDISIFSIIGNYISYIFDMLIITVALLPLACLLFAISQISNSPLLITLIGIYALKVISSILLPSSGLDQFLYQFIDLPTQLVFTHEPIKIISELSLFSIVAMYALSAVFLSVSVTIQKHGEFYFVNLLRRKP